MQTTHFETHKIRLAVALVMIAAFIATSQLCAQNATQIAAQSESQRDVTAKSKDNILDVRISGNTQIDAKTIHKIIKTRKDRPFSDALIEEDKRALMQKGWFIDVCPRVERTQDGYIVTFQFLERPIIHAVRFVGNSHHTKKKLQEESGLKAGEPCDPIAVRQAKERLEAFYREENFDRIHIEILSGDRIGDRSVVFLVDEGETRGAFYRVAKQRVLDVGFEGNSIASDSRLKTVIESKPGIFWFLMHGQFTRQKLDDDVEKLTAYYRNLGFFYAKVDRVFEENEGYSGMGKPNSWVRVKFLIEEGPRCKINEVRFIGNELFASEMLYQDLKSEIGAYYDQFTIDADIKRIKEKYGVLGYVFADVDVDPRIDDDQVHLVVKLKEGPKCRVSDIQVEILGGEGSAPYTKIHTVMNPLSIKPGDILSTKEVDDSRRRLMYSGIFTTNPTEGMTPEITFGYPAQALRDEEERTTRMANQPADNIRGQNPQTSPRSNNNNNNAPSVEDFRGQAQRSSWSNYGANSSAATQNEDSLNCYSDFFRVRRDVVAPVQIQQTISQTKIPQTVSAPSVYRGQQPETPYGSIAAQSSYAKRVANVSPFSSKDGGGMNIGPPTPIYDVPMKIRVQETRTGQVMLSVAVNSDAGLMGRIILDEQNFDICRVPKSFFRLEDWRNAFRGAGQHFRLEAMPGINVSRYEASWQTPYLFNLDYSLGLSGYYYQRGYDQWSEDRTGGTVSLGKSWTKDFSTALTFHGQSVRIYNPQMPAQDLLNALGRHPMYGFGLQATHDTRDNQYLATQGHRYTAGVEQVIGDFQFVRGNAEMNHYLMLRERPDRSGRWVLGIRNAASLSETTTPIYERYYAGGYSSLRGFEFRTVSPRDWGPNTFTNMPIGGCFEFYNSAELIFPITADDMVRGSLFLDSGTVQKLASKWDDPYRVSAGFGMRITVPMMGPMPIAIDFAFPLVKGKFDQDQLFTFNVGFMRM